MLTNIFYYIVAANRQYHAVQGIKVLKEGFWGSLFLNEASIEGEFHKVLLLSTA